MLTKLRKLQSKKGFTLIELMIVVAIIGILAAVAIPAFLRFIRKSKTSEAPISLKSLSDGAVSWFDADHSDTNGDPLAKHFPHPLSPNAVPAAATSSEQPAAAPCAAGNPLYIKDITRWGSEPWVSLKFGISKAHYYKYTYEQNGTGNSSVFTVSAASDLDCDSTLSSYVQRASVEGGSGEVTRTNLIVQNALE